MRFDPRFKMERSQLIDRHAAVARMNFVGRFERKPSAAVSEKNPRLRPPRFRPETCEPLLRPSLSDSIFSMAKKFGGAGKMPTFIAEKNAAATICSVFSRESP
jgi:hypothetical protein